MSAIQPLDPEGSKYAEFLPQLGQDASDLDPARETAIRAHLDRCAYCRAQLANYNRLDLTLRTYVDRLASAAPSAEAVLQAAVGASTKPALPVPLNLGPRGDTMLDQDPRRVTDSSPTLVDMTQARRVSRRRPVLAVVAALLLVALAAGLFTALAQTRQNPIGHEAQPTAMAQPSNVPTAPTLQGRSILVSLSQQQLYAYDNGTLAFTIPIVTGAQNAQVKVPLGDTHLLSKSVGDAGIDIMSPYPTDSPSWYPKVHIHYWLEFRNGGYFFYDAWWRTTFGPGSPISGYTPNQPTVTPPATWAIPGGVEMRAADAQRLNAWATIGALIEISAGV